LDEERNQEDSRMQLAVKGRQLAGTGWLAGREGNLLATIGCKMEDKWMQLVDTRIRLAETEQKIASGAISH
jgi:hypothetical protein